MLVIDEYLAVRVLVGAPPPELDLDETLALPAYRHYRLLQRIHSPGSGQMSKLLSDADQQAIRRPHPEVLQVLDPRPLLDEPRPSAPPIAQRGYWSARPSPPAWSTGAGSGSETARNVGRRMAEIADDLGISVHVSEPDTGR